MNEEEFVEKLQLTLKSDPQPNLVPFLKVVIISICLFLNLSICLFQHFVIRDLQYTNLQ